MDPSEIHRLIEEALGALREGNDVRALAIIDQLATASPDDPVVRAMRAQALLGADRSEEAFAEASQAVRLDESNQYAQRLLGLAAWRLDRITLAQESFQRAIELSDRNPAVLAEYAWFMANRRGPRLAEKAAREAINADDRCSTAWAALGLAQYKLRHHDEAQASLHRALELNPADLYAQSAMAVLLQERRQDGQAEALADLLRETPGTEDLVETIRGEAKKRKISKMLVERDSLPQQPAGLAPRKVMACLVAFAVMASGLWILVEPRSAAALALCLAAPILMLWGLYKLVD